MQITLTNSGKRFNRDWIFRKLSYSFTAGTSYAIVGPNGSGKSTLLQTIAGAVNLSEGTCEWFMQQDKAIELESIYLQLAIAAPYLEVIEEMSAKEFLTFHTSFKPLIKPIDEILEIVGLKEAAKKQIRLYSSGMKQRVKLAQAIFSDVPVLLLDEPCTNLDLTGYELYRRLINDYCADKLIIVSSNDQQEYGFCKEVISIMEYKQ
ncbi:ATP-binding cassette domain-containing protein [Chitinophagaceae bacterium LWZ2-11]